MRLWHKDMIPYLPKQQLLGQWRELCCIAVLLAKEHTPNHVLVNPIIDYSPDHFECYCNLIIKEMRKRKYDISDKALHTLEDNVRAWRIYLNQELPFFYLDSDWDLELEKPLFDEWHTKRYLKQCYYNLEEKYDRGGIPWSEWIIIFANFGG